jgi:hypothetical protein
LILQAWIGAGHRTFGLRRIPLAGISIYAQIPTSFGARLFDLRIDWAVFAKTESGKISSSLGRPRPQQK